MSETDLDEQTRTREDAERNFRNRRREAVRGHASLDRQVRMVGSYFMTMLIALGYMAFFVSSQSHPMVYYQATGDGLILVVVAFAYTFLLAAAGYIGLVYTVYIVAGGRLSITSTGRVLRWATPSVAMGLGAFFVGAPFFASFDVPSSWYELPIGDWVNVHPDAARQLRHYGSIVVSAITALMVTPLFIVSMRPWLMRSSVLSWAYVAGCSLGLAGTSLVLFFLCIALAVGAAGIKPGDGRFMIAMLLLYTILVILNYHNLLGWIKKRKRSRLLRSAIGVLLPIKFKGFLDQEYNKKNMPLTVKIASAVAAAITARIWWFLGGVAHSVVDSSTGATNFFRSLLGL